MDTLPGTPATVALVSAPWPIYFRPSVPLGALKADLRRRFPQLRVDAHHLFLLLAKDIGYKRYQAISERTWLAETVFAALLFPEQKAAARRLFTREARGRRALQGVGFDALVDQVAKSAERWLDAVDASGWLLAGFSNSLCQLTATLYFIRRIKQRWPELPIVLGGSGLSSAPAPAIRAAFPEIDVVVHGEGEKPLAAIAAHLLEGRPVHTLHECEAGAARDQVADLADLPVPDYDDYFALLGSFDPPHRFFPQLGVEMSRGCWWRHCGTAGGRSGCAFCNLNLQWQGYRHKKARQVVTEVATLTRRHQILSVAFMDNVLPPAETDRAFSGLAELGMDLALFAEMRATQGMRRLAALKRAGLREVQIGIESLSTRLLKRLNKGTRAIDNVEIMKHCQALGVANRSNLILEFPGSDAEEVAETLRNLDFVQWFPPLRPVSFWLGYGSGVWQAPGAYGIKAVFNHPRYGALFPGGPLRRLRHMIQGYRGDRGRQRKRWQPVRRRLDAWASRYAALSGGGRTIPLQYADGGDFMIIRQARRDGDPLNHRLTGTSRAIYRYCDRQRSLASVLGRFATFEEAQVRAFLRGMVDKRLMFEEGDRYLGLAVRV